MAEVKAEGLDAEAQQELLNKATGAEASEEVTEQTEPTVWGDLAEDLDSQDNEDEVVDEVEAPKEETPKEEATEEQPVSKPAEAEKPKEEIAASEEKPATPETQPKEEKPKVEQKAEKPEAPQPEEKTPEQVAQAAEERAKLRNDAIDELAKSYQLTDEDAQLFLTKPEEVVPRFRAELFMDVYEAVATNLTQNMPALITSVQQNIQAVETAESAFYEANPLLSRAEHKAMVDRYAAAYVQVNPKATREDVQRDVGIQVMYALGIDPNGAAQTTTQEPAKEEETLAPYKPAGAGGATTPAPASSNNVWGNIAEELMEDEG